MKYIKFVLLGIVIIAAIFFGFCIRNYPLIKFNPELKVYEVLNLMLTASIGIFIPFFIKKWIEDSRQIKNNLIEELKEYLKETERISDKIKFCYSRNAIHQTDKEEINFLFNQCDIKFNMLDQLFTTTFDDKTKDVRSQLKDLYLTYWKLVTSGEVMNSKFIAITEDFYRRHNDCYIKIETMAKQIINKIHRL